MSESRIDSIVRRAAIPSDSIGRLQRVIERDFGHYATEKNWNTYAGEGRAVSVGTLSVVEWDWGLLRHDIHVLIHRLRTAGATLHYRGYSGRIVPAAPGLLYGEVVGIRDVVTFEGKSVKAFEKAFHDSVDDYLAMCAECGEEPNHECGPNV